MKSHQNCDAIESVPNLRFSVMWKWSRTFWHLTLWMLCVVFGGLSVPNKKRHTKWCSSFVVSLKRLTLISVWFPLLCGNVSCDVLHEIHTVFSQFDAMCKANKRAQNAQHGNIAVGKTVSKSETKVDLNQEQMEKEVSSILKCDTWE